MPLRDEETLFGLVCKIYDDGLVKVGTNTERFILRLKPGEDLEQRLRAQLIKRGWSAEDLPEDATAPLQQASPESEQQQPDPEQPAAESTVLFGSTRCGLKRQHGSPTTPPRSRPMGGSVRKGGPRSGP